MRFRGYVGSQSIKFEHYSFRYHFLTLFEVLFCFSSRYPINFFGTQQLKKSLSNCFILENIGAGSGNRTRTLSLEGSYDTISPYPHSPCYLIRSKFSVKRITIVNSIFTDVVIILAHLLILFHYLH